MGSEDHAEHLERYLVASDLSPASTMVVIAGGDTVVGHALEILLHSSRFSVRFLPESHLSKLEQELDGVQLLLLSPGLEAERREALLMLVERAPADRRPPILELVASSQRVEYRPGHSTAPWPCRMEELKRRVKLAMLAGQEASTTVRSQP